MKIKANGITFNCDISGPEGAPWLIFSNSLATDLHMWDPQETALKDRFRILRHDQRGHGATEAPAGRYTFDLLCDDVIALMDALNIGKAHWCGLSMGCATGMGLAQKHPDRFGRFVLCDSSGRSSPESGRQWEDRIAIALKDGMAPLVEPTVQRWFPPEVYKANAPQVDIIRTMIRTTPVNGFVGCAAALADHDFRKLMPSVKNPVLWMCGDQDGPNTAAMKVMQGELPGSQLVVLPNAGHISNLDQPAMFSKALAEFLSA